MDMDGLLVPWWSAGGDGEGEAMELWPVSPPMPQAAVAPPLWPMDMDGPAAVSMEGLLVPWWSGSDDDDDDDDGEAMLLWRGSPPRPMLAGSEDLIRILTSAPMYSPPRFNHYGGGVLDYRSPYYYNSEQVLYFPIPVDQSPPPRTPSPFRSWSQEEEEGFDRLWSNETNSAPAAANLLDVAEQVPGQGSSAGTQKRQNRIQLRSAIIIKEALNSFEMLRYLRLCYKSSGVVSNLFLKIMGVLKVTTIHVTEEPENESIQISTLVVLLISIDWKKLHSGDILDCRFHKTINLRLMMPIMEIAKLKEIRIRMFNDFILGLRKNVSDTLKCSSSEGVDTAGTSSMLGAAPLSVNVFGKLLRIEPAKAKVALSQLMRRLRFREMYNSCYLHVIRNENRGCSDLMELGHQDVQVQPGDASRKRKKCSTPRTKSKAWLHFTKVVDTEGYGGVKAECKHCGKLLKADSKIDGTSHLVRHITGFHKMELDGPPSTKRSSCTHKQTICQGSISEVDSAASMSSMLGAHRLSFIKKLRRQPDKAKLTPSQLMSPDEQGLQLDNAKATLSQLMSRDKHLEMNNSCDLHIIGNESRGSNELIELGHKDVHVEEPGESTSKTKSKVWLHFTKVEDPEGSGVVKGQCKYCGNLLKADTKRHGTSRLRRHILDVHKMEL